MRGRLGVSVRRRFAVAALASLIVLAGGCGSDPPDPFAYVYGTGVGPWPARTGWQLGYLVGDAANTSHSTLTIDSAILRGPGIGTVVSVQVKIAPLVKGTTATPGGNYVADPPVSDFGTGGCHKQALYPVQGYRVKPGGQFRLWIIITALRPGRWNLPRQVITYTQDGDTYQHSFPIRYWGSVIATAPVHAVADPDVAPCVKPEGAHYLNYYHG